MKGFKVVKVEGETRDRQETDKRQTRDRQERGERTMEPQRMKAKES